MQDHTHKFRESRIPIKMDVAMASEGKKGKIKKKKTSKKTTAAPAAAPAATAGSAPADDDADMDAAPTGPDSDRIAFRDTKAADHGCTVEEFHGSDAEMSEGEEGADAGEDEFQVVTRKTKDGKDSGKPASKKRVRIGGAEIKEVERVGKVEIEEDSDDVMEDEDDAAAQQRRLSKRRKAAQGGAVKTSEKVRKSKKAARVARAALEMRRVSVPAHRYSPLKRHWQEIVTPLVVHLKLQVRMNTRRRCIEVRPPPPQFDQGVQGSAASGSQPQQVQPQNYLPLLQKACDFLKAFMLGFEVADAIALLRLDDLFIDSFEVRDVKFAGMGGGGGNVRGHQSGSGAGGGSGGSSHLSRCIARLAGAGGQTKHAIENSTRTRIVIAGDRYIHILGAFQNIRLARNAVCSLILGAQAAKVYQQLRQVGRRLGERL